LAWIELKAKESLMRAENCRSVFEVAERSAIIATVKPRVNSTRHDKLRQERQNKTILRDCFLSPPAETVFAGRFDRQLDPVCTQMRNIPIPGLTPGKAYDFPHSVYRGSTGQTDWSDAFSHMAT